jgi:basic membrane protein A
MKKHAVLLIILCLFIAVSCGKKDGTTTTQTGSIKVGLVFDVGGRGDKSFNDAAYGPGRR